MIERAVALPPEALRITTDASTLPFWEAAKQGRLVASQCGDCGFFRLPPTPFCPACRSTNVDWPELSGQATVFSFSVVRGFPGIPDIILVPAILDLPDAPGARLVAPLVDVDPGDVHIGMTATVDFTPISDGWMLPVFRSISLKGARHVEEDA